MRGLLATGPLANPKSHFGRAQNFHRRSRFRSARIDVKRADSLSRLQCLNSTRPRLCNTQTIAPSTESDSFVIRYAAKPMRRVTHEYGSSANKKTISAFHTSLVVDGLDSLLCLPRRVQPCLLAENARHERVSIDLQLRCGRQLRNGSRDGDLLQEWQCHRRGP